ncbi:alpha/beta hydrolase [Dysgonomonas sp. ZJ709]|uniref:alpha/beta hydrolase n=1 Tax=Dysgonomonas sp. ZJ709 TaxID=2709797 RepID=UPI0013EA82F6|nr:alpha/beta hydrolase [Dysgonomonas sp. ZJ709]
MKKQAIAFYSLLVILILLPNNIFAQLSDKEKIREYTFDLYDDARERSIPVVIYSPQHDTKNAKVVIMSHGYGKNVGESYKSYSAITKELASKGYFVLSIQHELADDDLLAMDGNLYETRMPNWERGVKNILFTISEFKEIRPDLDWTNVNLIGHSNGGDMTMLFAAKYPSLTKRAISLDHRRMPMPRANSPKLYSLRGSDFEADKDVLPTADEQKKYSITIVKLDDVKHGDMDDKGSPAQLEKINRYLLEFLND